ncbi:MAG: ABC transporter ATP-binding protein [Myxococcota bacterium]
MTNALVQLNNVRASRGSFDLHIPQWSVQPGQVVGLVGPNGVGKTTLLRLLAGIDPAQSGSISVLGLNPVSDFVAVRSRCAFMSDDQALFSMRISKLLQFMSGYYPSWDDAHVGELLERFELDPKANSGELSRGQSTRLRLLLAMAFRPDVLLLDEPGSGLDLAGRRKLLKSVVEIAGSGNRSVIISSHQLGDVERICDRLLVLNDGQVLREGTAEELIHDGQSLEDAMFTWGAA